MPAVDAKPGFSFSPGVVKFAKDCTAGTIGGIAVVGVGHPFGTFITSVLHANARRIRRSMADHQ